MTAYYNEIDPYAAQWLRNLIDAGHIAPGVVDERSIEDVVPAELAEYTQCHFFAGVGVWSYALRAAGWPDDKPVWTGSCPCQPFSAAGKGAGFTDERHLWPAFFHLIEQCHPGNFFGEQVASKDGLGWLDLVQADLEGAGYASGAIDLCAAGVGAPHIRQRLWLVAERMEHPQHQHQRPTGQLTQRARDSTGASEVGGLADTSSHGCNQQKYTRSMVREARTESEYESSIIPDDVLHRGAVGNLGPTDSLWSSCDWLYCRDGKWRPVEPGTFPLAHGATSRVGRLRAYGNAINAEAAKTVIQSYLEMKFK